MSANIIITLDKEFSIVLYEALIEIQKKYPFKKRSMESAIDSLICDLEKSIPEIFLDNYQDILREAELKLSK